MISKYMPRCDAAASMSRIVSATARYCDVPEI